MEVVGAISAIVTIAGLGLKVHDVFSAYIHRAKRATSSVRSLKNKLSATVFALNDIHDLLEQEQEFHRTGTGRRLFTANSLQATKTTVSECEEVFKSLIDFVNSKGRTLNFGLRKDDDDKDLVEPFDQKVVLSRQEKIK